jgi:hypothetical protein
LGSDRRRNYIYNGDIMYSGTGTVTTVSAKPFTDKWGKNITLYSFQIGGDQAWYRTGTNEPPCKEGDIINFVFEQQGNNKKVDPSSINVTGQGNVPTPQAQPARAASSGGNSRDDYWKQKEAYDKEVTQPRISYAAAQKNAVQIVKTALECDALGFGSAKKADKMEMLLNYVDEVTNHFAVRLDSGHEIMADLRAADGAVEPNLVDEDEMYAAAG